MVGGADRIPSTSIPFSEGVQKGVSFSESKLICYFNLRAAPRFFRVVDVVVREVSKNWWTSPGWNCSNMRD